MPPPRRRGRQAALGVFFVLVLGAVGAYLYLRFGQSSDSSAVPPPPPTLDAGAAAAPIAVASDAGVVAPLAPPVVALAPAADAAVEPVAPVVIVADAAPAVEPDAATDPDAEPAVVDGDAEPEAEPAGPAVPPDCGDELGEARSLWRSRDRDGAIAKLRRALACTPGDLEPLLQWGRWALDFPALVRDRATAAEAADTFGAAAEANPDHGELWFHYTNLLFKAGRREEALAARTHCQSIRPANEYVQSCRFLPE